MFRLIASFLFAFLKKIQDTLNTFKKNKINEINSIQIYRKKFMIPKWVDR